jgi:hypothetical protein
MTPVSSSLAAVGIRTFMLSTASPNKLATVNSGEAADGSYLDRPWRWKAAVENQTSTA